MVRKHEHPASIYTVDVLYVYITLAVADVWLVHKIVQYDSPVENIMFY